jgi:hypothetical protein
MITELNKCPEEVVRSHANEAAVCRSALLISEVGGAGDGILCYVQQPNMWFGGTENLQSLTAADR